MDVKVAAVWRFDKFNFFFLDCLLTIYRDAPTWTIPCYLSKTSNTSNSGGIFQTIEGSLCTVRAVLNRSITVCNYIRLSHRLVLVAFGTASRQSITGFGIRTTAALIGRKRHLVIAVSRRSSADARASGCLSVDNEDVQSARDVFCTCALYS